MVVGLGIDRRNIGLAIGNHMLLVLVVVGVVAKRTLDIAGRRQRRKWIQPGLVVIELGVLDTGFEAVVFVAVGLLLEMQNLTVGSVSMMEMEGGGCIWRRRRGV